MNNLNRIFDPNIRIPAPNPASRIGSVATRNETNQEMLKPIGQVSRQITSDGTSNIIPTENGYMGLAHTIRGPFIAQNSVGVKTELSGSLSFSDLSNYALDKKEVSVITFRDGKEQRLPAIITSLDEETKTFTISNPLDQIIQSGDSNAPVLLDINKQSFLCGYVNAFANGDEKSLRVIRPGESSDMFPDDIEIFDEELKNLILALNTGEDREYREYQVALKDDFSNYDEFIDGLRAMSIIASNSDEIRGVTFKINILNQEQEMVIHTGNSEKWYLVGMKTLAEENKWRTFLKRNYKSVNDENAFKINKTVITHSLNNSLNWKHKFEGKKSIESDNIENQIDLKGKAKLNLYTLAFIIPESMRFRLVKNAVKMCLKDYNQVIDWNKFHSRILTEWSSTFNKHEQTVGEISIENLKNIHPNKDHQDELDELIKKYSE